MQIIRATHLYSKKEIGKENICRQQEEGGDKEITNVGDRAKCPQCDKIGRVVWISQDGKTAGIQCAAIHRQMNRPESKFGSNSRPQSKANKNMVFLVEIKREA
jgi:ribosomal protein L44E